MDSKTVLGYYISSFTFLIAFIVCWVILFVNMGFFISLSFYVDAFAEDFKSLITEMNDEIIFENKQGSKSRTHSSGKLSEAILVHQEMLKYLLSPPIRNQH